MILTSNLHGRDDCCGTEKHVRAGEDIVDQTQDHEDDVGQSTFANS